MSIHNEAVTEFSDQLKWLSSTQAYRDAEDLDSKLNKVNIHKVRYTSTHICTICNQRTCTHADTRESTPDQQSPSCSFSGLPTGTRSFLPPPPPPLLPGAGCVPRGRHLPFAPLVCATSHLQGIELEPPECTEKKDKKIAPNENQKHHLLPLRLPPLPLLCHELGKTREEKN